MLSLALLHVATVILLSSAKLPDLGEHHWLLKLLGADKSGNTAVRSPRKFIFEITISVMMKRSGVS